MSYLYFKSRAMPPGLGASVTSFNMYWPSSLDTQMAFAVASVQYMFDDSQSTTRPGHGQVRSNDNHLGIP